MPPVLWQKCSAISAFLRIPHTNHSASIAWVEKAQHSSIEPRAAFQHNQRPHNLLQTTHLPVDSRGCLMSRHAHAMCSTVQLADWQAAKWCAEDMSH